MTTPKTIAAELAEALEIVLDDWCRDNAIQGYAEHFDLYDAVKTGKAALTKYREAK